MTTMTPFTSPRLRTHVPAAAVWDGGRPHVGPKVVRGVRPLTATGRTQQRSQPRRARKEDINTYVVAALFGLVLGCGFLLNETVLSDDGATPAPASAVTVVAQ